MAESKSFNLEMDAKPAGVKDETVERSYDILKGLKANEDASLALKDAKAMMLAELAALMPEWNKCGIKTVSCSSGRVSLMQGIGSAFSAKKAKVALISKGIPAEVIAEAFTAATTKTPYARLQYTSSKMKGLPVDDVGEEGASGEEGE